MNDKCCPLKIKNINGCHSIWMNGTCIKGGIYGTESAQSYLENFKKVWIDGYDACLERLSDEGFLEGE